MNLSCYFFIIYTSKVQSKVCVIDLYVQNAKKRVVVTGMGVVSSVGDELDVFFDNLCAGKSGISAIESFDVHSDEWTTRIAGEIKDFDPGDLISKKMARRLDRSIMFTLVAGKKALIDAKLPLQIKYDGSAHLLHVVAWFFYSYAVGVYTCPSSCIGL